MRILPVGTPIILKTPGNERDVLNLTPCTFSMGRVAELPEEGTDLYGLAFEGITLPNGEPMTLYYTRNEFVLARAGT